MIPLSKKFNVSVAYEYTANSETEAKLSFLNDVASCPGHVYEDCEVTEVEDDEVEAGEQPVLAPHE